MGLLIVAIYLITFACMFFTAMLRDPFLGTWMIVLNIAFGAYGLAYFSLNLILVAAVFVIAIVVNEIFYWAIDRYELWL